jgi:hypothetical protein
MTWAQIRQHVLDTDVTQVRNLQEWQRTYRSIIADRLRKKLPTREEVVQAFYNTKW